MRAGKRVCVSVLALSGWGQPHDALEAVAPGARHVDYAGGTLEQAMDTLAGYADARTVIGWSMGGMLAVRAVAAGVLRPERLVLIATPYQFARTPARALGMPQDVLAQYRENFVRSPERTLQKSYALIAHGDARAERVQPQLQAARARLPGHDWLYWLDVLAAGSAQGLDLQGFPPTVLVHGDRDAVIRLEQSEAFARALPQAALHVFEGCGHAPHWHDGARLMRLAGLE